MTLKIIDPPASEFVTVAEVKTSGRVDTDALDSAIELNIAAARQIAEDRTGRGFITQTWDLLLDAFPEKEIEVGKLPIQSITFVKYYDTDGTLQTLDSSLYVLDADTLPGWVLPAYGETWPSTLDVANAVQIRFVAGYGDEATDVPATIKGWIIAQAAAATNNPEGLTDGKAVALPFVDSLLDAYKLRW